tara:strand:+ start:484 stop:1365 length:882 start_codon:yes stop_codon:yes gene_type:complete
VNKILVIATGWHFSSHFYENMVKQEVPEGWGVDYFCVAHRFPEDDNTVQEKEDVRNSDGNNFLNQLDQIMYQYPITTQQISSLGWHFMIEDNTIGDMECFNQWSDHYDYKDYDFILVTHDDNLILSDQLFVDIVGGVEAYKPIEESRYGAHQFNIESVKLDSDWMFLDNGYTESLPKAFTPRGSFSFYRRELIDMLPDNKFNMYENGGYGIVNRKGETASVGYDGIKAWNTHAGTFRDFLYDVNLVENTRWLSDMKRVSKYCIEGERGFVSNYRAGENYLVNVQKQLKELGWI